MPDADRTDARTGARTGALNSAAGWARASELFLEFADLEVSDRARRMAELERRDPKLHGAVSALLGEDPGAEPVREPRRFGPYVEVQRIGAGGMGEVFLARRSDGTFERDVAVKLLRPGLEGQETTERFLRERQTLAALEHESIVRLLDGGATEDGRPYLVMEYVDGMAIDEFANERDLDLRARLRLFCRVLEGVAHAHARGVVHRDLKPSNVMVRHDGAPRIVDFGIARVMGDADLAQRTLTRTGSRMFTLAYASPEQILGERVTAAGDVFSLGVMLYGLVSGRSPWPEGATGHRLERAVLHGAPPPPSRVADPSGRRALRGDLDTIVLHCLDPSPARRYPDAQVLADELERYLGGLTIRARPIGVAHRLTRWLARHPWHAASMAATLFAGLALVWILIGRAREAERQAAMRAALPARIQAAGELARAGLVERARDSIAAIESDLASLPVAPELEVEVSIAHARIALHGGDAPRALELVADARRKSNGADPDVLAKLAMLEANAHGAAGDAAAAEEVAAAALEKYVGVGAVDLATQMKVVTTLARVRLDSNRAGDAVELLQEHLETARSSGEERSPVAAEVAALLGRAYVATGRAADAIPLLEEALDSQRWHHGTKHADIAETMTFLGQAQLGAGNAQDAVETLSTARDAYETLDRPKAQVLSVDVLAQAANAVGDFELALECLRDNQATIDASLPESRPYWFITEYQAAFVLRAMGRVDDSREAFERALSGGDEGVRALGRGAEVQVRTEYARLLEQLGEAEAARQQLERSLELWEAEHGPEHPFAQQLRARLGS